MELEFLKQELQKLSLENLQLLFDELISKKKIEQKELQQYHNNLQKLCIVLNILCVAADYEKKRLALFDFIGCSFDDVLVSSIIESTPISRFNLSKNIQCMYRCQFINPEEEFQAELKAYHSKIGAKAHEHQNQEMVRKALEDYHSELIRFYNKFGRKLCERNYFKVFYNGLKAKEKLPYSKTEESVYNDIKCLSIYG